MPTIAEKRRAFRRLHDKGCFVLPQPWNVGTARYLQSLGFKALGSTSSGLAFSEGLVDGAVPLDMLLRHLREVSAAVDIPLSADFQSGYASDLSTLESNVRRCIETGVAGLSIEDATGDRNDPLYSLDVAVARLRAVRAVIDRTGADIVLTARTEGFMVGKPDLNDSIRRLVAYANAGADCLYAPGVQARDQIVALVDAVAPKPVNVLIRSTAGLTVADLADLGVRRVSVGGGLARVAWTAFMRAANLIAEEGRFDMIADAMPHAELNAFLADNAKKRGW